MASTLIDTRIWILALRAPMQTPGSSLGELSARAADVVRATLRTDRVLFTSQIVGEIHHVARARARPPIPADLLRRYLSQLLRARNVRFRGLRRLQAEEAVELSSDSGIHIWDYLAVLPWRGRIDRIVTMDPHYRHPHFRSMARIDNPLGLWRHEGQALGG